MAPSKPSSDVATQVAQHGCGERWGSLLHCRMCARKHRFVVIGGFGESVSLCELPVIVEGFGEHPARLAASKASSGTIDRLPSAIRRSSPVFLLMVNSAV